MDEQQGYIMACLGIMLLIVQALTVNTEKGHCDGSEARDSIDVTALNRESWAQSVLLFRS